LLDLMARNATPARDPTVEAVGLAEQTLDQPSSLGETSTGGEARIEGVDPAAVAEVQRVQRIRMIRDSPEVTDAELDSIEYLDRNPRLVKRFHNAFRLQLYVANEERSGSFNFSQDQLRALGRWVAVRLRWPALADVLARERWLLGYLEAEANGISPRLSATQEQLDQLRMRHARWFDDDAVSQVLREPVAGRRVSALALESFLPVA
jgi:hypothetical protein